MVILLFCGPCYKKTHPFRERMGLDIDFLASPAVPLPIIVGPETLRPTLSEGLPFSDYFVLSLLSEYMGGTFRMVSQATKSNQKTPLLFVRNGVLVFKLSPFVLG
jgi:hypothetical protein